MGLKRRGSWIRRGGELEVNLMGIHRYEGNFAFSRIEMKKPVLRLAHYANQSAMCGFHSSSDQGVGGPNGQVVSVKRTTDGSK